MTGAIATVILLYFLMYVRTHAWAHTHIHRHTYVHFLGMFALSQMLCWALGTQCR